VRTSSVLHHGLVQARVSKIVFTPTLVNRVAWQLAKRWPAATTAVGVDILPGSCFELGVKPHSHGG
jgi:hypothetical protein